MELRLATLVLIVALVAVGAFVTRAWRPQASVRGLVPVLGARLLVVLVVTALVIAAWLGAAVVRTGDPMTRGAGDLGGRDGLIAARGNVDREDPEHAEVTIDAS